MKIIYTTIDNKENAEKLAEELTKTGLVACTNIMNATSVYTWKGEVTKENECVMIVKTRKDLVDQVIEKIRELHPYDLPVMDVIDVEKNNEGVEEWLNKATK